MIFSVAWVVAGTLIMLVRQAGVPSYDTLWAEDGERFLRDALAEPIESIFSLYAGYLHLPPRLIAAAAGAGSLENAAAIFAAASALVVALVSLYVFVASESAVASPWLRAALAGSVLLIPAGAYETANNATNLHWYLTYGCFWALLDRSVSRHRQVGAGAVSFAATLSNPMAGLLFPLAVWELVKRPSARERIPLFVYLAGLSVQAGFVLWGTSQTGLGDEAGLLVAYGETDWSEIPRLYGLGVTATLLVGEQFLADVWDLLGWDVWYLAGLVFLLLAVAVAVKHPDRRIRVLGPVAFLLSVLFFALPVGVRGTAVINAPPPDATLLGSRYVMLSMLFLLTLLVLAVDGLASARRTRILPIVFSGALLISFAFTFRVHNARSDGPSWSRGVQEAERSCRSDGREAQIPHSPSGWSLDVGCNSLTR
jgi:hypothetical protein